MLQMCTQRTIPTHYPVCFAANPLQLAEKWVSEYSDRPFNVDTTCVSCIKAMKVVHFNMLLIVC